MITFYFIKSGSWSITALSGQRNSDSSTNYTVEFNDRYKAQAGNVQLDHILGSVKP